MKSVMLVVAGSLALALAPLAFAQDHAVSRGGGGGGSSSGGGGGHPVASSGGSSSGGSTYSGGSTGSSSGVAPSTAEQRHPRAGTGRGSHGGGYYGYPGQGGGYYGYPGYYGGGYGGWYYPGWYGSYWWPYGSYGWYGGYWGSPYGGWGGWGGGTAYHYAQRESGAVRVLVDPSEARVYVDGYYAGIVDDYDGLFQRLNIAPGRHEITLKLEGYQTHRMKVYVSPNGTLKLHYTMQKGTGETVEDLVGNAPEARGERDRGDERWRERERQDRDDVAVAGSTGKLKLAVHPPDASVYVDGAFRGTGREAASLQLPSGRHRIEVVRPGYHTVERDVEVTPGETTDLSVDLEKSSS